MSSSSPTYSALPWLAVAWIATVLVVAVLIYLLARAVLGKTDPQKLPEVLCALTPLLNGVARALTQLPPALSSDEMPRSGKPAGDTGDKGVEKIAERPVEGAS
jgi:hypothetical protein